MKAALFDLDGVVSTQYSGAHSVVNSTLNTQD